MGKGSRTTKYMGASGKQNNHTVSDWNAYYKAQKDGAMMAFASGKMTKAEYDKRVNDLSERRVSAVIEASGGWSYSAGGKVWSLDTNSIGGATISVNSQGTEYKLSSVWDKSENPSQVNQTFNSLKEAQMAAKKELIKRNKL